MVRTPPEFIAAVEERFGRIGVDLAATEENTVVRSGFGYFPNINALTEEWTGGSLRWLNPPFANIGPWARRCAEESARGCRVALLIPASVGSDWFNSWVRPFAYVFELAPRLTFVGHSSCYPKDLILALYEKQRLTGRAAWRWKK